MIAVAFCVLVTLGLQENAARGWVEKLGSEKIGEREEAERRLKDLGEAALPELRKAEQAGIAEVAERARRLVRIIGARVKLTPEFLKAFPSVDERLGLGDDHAWTVALLEGVHVIYESKKAPPITFHDLDPLVGPALRGARPGKERDDVFQLFQNHHFESAAPELLAMLASDDRALRIRVIGSLGNLHAPQIAPALTKLLDDQDSAVRAEATLALGSRGSKESIPRLVELLKDPSPQVRQRTAASLMLLDARSAIPELEAQLKDPDPKVRAYAPYVLSQMRVRSAIPDIVSLLADGDSDVRSGAAQALGHLKAAGELGALQKCLKDPHDSVRYSALWALGEIGEPRSSPWIQESLADSDGFVRRQALEVLLRMQATDARPAILQILANKEDSLSAQAAEGLCLWGDRAGVPTVLEGTGSLRVLNRIRRPDVWKTLSELKISGGNYGERREMVEKTAKAGGLAVEWAKEAPPGQPAEWTELQVFIGNPGSSLLEALTKSLERTGAEFILERDRVRILPRVDALKAWQTWWRSAKE